MSGFQGYIRLPGPVHPTPVQLACLIEAVNRGDKGAAAHLGITNQTLKNHLYALYGRIGARSRAHAVALLWPVIGAELLPSVGCRDRRLGMERRRASDRNLQDGLGMSTDVGGQPALSHSEAA